MATFLLTDLNAVKTACKVGGEEDDGVLTLWLRTVSAEAAHIMNRKGGIERKSRVEVYDVDRLSREIRLRASPVTAVSLVEWDPLGQFTSPTTLDANLYTRDERKGLLHLNINLSTQLSSIGTNSPDGGARQALRVTYTGGIATDLESMRADDEWDDLEAAVLLQIHAMWKRRTTTPGEFSESGQGGSVRLGALRWVPQAKAILMRHRRRNIG